MTHPNVALIVPDVRPFAFMVYVCSLSSITFSVFCSTWQCINLAQTLSATSLSCSIPPSIPAVQLAISNVQGLLDLVLEISTDLSSAAPVIPSSSNQGPGSSKKNPPVDVAVKPINSHASLTDLVTAKLTGMANLALPSLGWGGGGRAAGRVERDDYSLLVKGSLPLSFEASLLLIVTAVDMLPTASTVDSVELCDRNLGLESIDIPSVPSHTTSAALGCDPTPTLSTQLTAATHAAFPLSARLGGLGHACHQAAVTALHALSPTSTISDVNLPGLRRSSSLESELVALLLAVFQAYKSVASICIEDVYLSEAADAAESLIRGEASTSTDSLSLPVSRSHRASRQSEGHPGTRGPGPPLSRSGRTGGRLESSSLCDTVGGRGQTVPGADDAAVEATELRSDPLPDIHATYNRIIDISEGSTYSTGSHASSAHGSRFLDRSFQHRGIGQLEQSVRVGIPMSRLKSREDSGPNWSDDSSEDSDSVRSVDGDAQPALSSRSVSFVSVPDDILSRSVVLLPNAVQDCLDRYDLPSTAMKGFQKEYDTASSGNTIS